MFVFATDLVLQEQFNIERGKCDKSHVWEKWKINWKPIVQVRMKIVTLQNGGIYSPVVTLCSSNFNIQQFYVHPHRLFMCLESISEQTTIVSLYNINLLSPRYV